MTHPDVRAQIDLLIDKELDTARAREVEAHLASCADCRAFRDERLVLRSTIRAELPPLRAPATLRVPAARRAVASRMWAPLALAASLAVAVFGGYQLGVRRSADDRLAGEVLASHVRALMPGHLTDVLSSDQHTVKPWFNGKVDFSPPVSDFAGAGYPLIGGRLDYVGERAVAVLSYGRRQHVVDVMIWPETGDQGASEETRQGYHLLHWTSAGFSYWMASDLGMAELRTLAQLIRQSDSAAATAAR